MKKEGRAYRAPLQLLRDRRFSDRRRRNRRKLVSLLVPLVAAHKLAICDRSDIVQVSLDCIQLANASSLRDSFDCFVEGHAFIATKQGVKHEAICAFAKSLRLRERGLRFLHNVGPYDFLNRRSNRRSFDRRNRRSLNDCWHVIRNDVEQGLLSRLCRDRRSSRLARIASSRLGGGLCHSGLLSSQYERQSKIARRRKNTSGL